MNDGALIAVIVSVIVLGSLMAAFIVLYCMEQKENEELKRKLEELVRLEDMSSQAFQAMMWEATHNCQAAQGKSAPQRSPSQDQEKPKVNSKTRI